MIACDCYLCLTFLEKAKSWPSLADHIYIYIHIFPASLATCQSANECVYIYICSYVHIYTYIYIYVYVCVYIYTYIYIYVHTCMHAIHAIIRGYCVYNHTVHAHTISLNNYGHLWCPWCIISPYSIRILIETSILSTEGWLWYNIVFYLGDNYHNSLLSHYHPIIIRVLYHYNFLMTLLFNSMYISQLQP